MKVLDVKEFLESVEKHGIAVDKRYPHSAVLSYGEDNDESRFWDVPNEAELRPRFILSMLELMGNWESCHVWRHLGLWPASAASDSVNHVVEFRILKGLNLPLGTSQIVEFSRNELDSLITLLFATTIFGWSVGEDLYVIPDHGRYILKTDHHGVIHIRFQNNGDIDAWVSQMTDRGFSLPEELLDETFKQPDWLNKKH